jgi:single-strand DNA-binding protein
VGFRINSVTIDGNLTRDPELRSLPSGQSVCSLRIAHNSRRKDGQTGEWVDVANFFDVTVWGGQGEWIARNVGKGTHVVVQGELRWREWDSKEGGKRQAVDINAENVVVQKGGSAPSGDPGGGGFTPRSDVPSNADDFAPAASGSMPGDGADDDIPF